MTDKLLSCPFCGCDDIYFAGDPPTSLTVCYAYCGQCGARTASYSPRSKAEVIAAWNRRAAGWIPVEERLPEKGECLVVSDGTVYPASVIFGEDFKHCTHWMPLPEPPKSQEGGAK